MNSVLSICADHKLSVVWSQVCLVRWNISLLRCVLILCKYLAVVKIDGLGALA